MKGKHASWPPPRWTGSNSWRFVGAPRAAESLIGLISMIFIRGQLHTVPLNVYSASMDFHKPTGAVQVGNEKTNAQSLAASQGFEP